MNFEIFTAIVKARIPEIIIVKRIKKIWESARFGRSLLIATAAPVLVLPIE